MYGRTRNIIVNGLVGISLLVCLGVVGLWVRSYSAEDQWGWTSSTQTTEQRSGLFQKRGRLAVGAGEVRTDRATGYSTIERTGWFTDPSAWVYAEEGAVMGFAAFPVSGQVVRAPEGGQAVRGWFVTVPHWFVAAVFAVLPVWWVMNVGAAERPVRALVWSLGILIGAAAMVAVLQTLALFVVIPLVFVGAVMGTISREPQRAGVVSC
jgi:hypothetical protein